MNARERMLATIGFEKTDRPFRWETPGIWSQTVARWAGEGLPPEAAADGGKMLEFLGYDRFDWVPNLDWGRDPYCPMFEREVFEDDGSYVTARDTDGAIKKNLKVNPELSMPQFVSFPVENMGDYEKHIGWRLDPGDDKRFPEGWACRKAELAVRDYPLAMHIVGPFGHARNLMGDMNLMYAFYEDPELITHMMGKWRDFYCGLLTKVCQTATPDAIMVFEDNCFKSGPFISPALFREFMLPGLRDVMAHARSLGVEGLWVDTDGNCTIMIPLYLEAGANGFYPFECKAGMDIVEVRRQYGKKITIIGGIEKYTLSDAMTERDMMDEVDRKVIPMFELGGYIPMLDHSAPPNISLKRFLRFLEYVRDLPGKYKQ